MSAKSIIEVNLDRYEDFKKTNDPDYTQTDIDYIREVLADAYFRLCRPKYNRDKSKES